MNKENRFRIQWRFLISAGVYSIFLLFFYFRYVPVVLGFQAVLVPVLCMVFFLTAVRFKWGFLFFVFAFPLINNLPYFFKIYGNIPHAPTALVLFLVFFLGWLINSAFTQKGISFQHPIFKPLVVLSFLVLVSGLITFLRFSNFFPFITHNVFELKTNVNGVTAGGAIMSVVFFALNYLTGFALFFIILSRIKEKEFVKKICVVLLVSISFSMAFGFYQHVGNIKCANNPVSFTQGFINGTFKDAMSFGGYLAVIIPVLLSLIFFFKGVLRIFSVPMFLLAVFLLPHSGSRSGLVALTVSLMFFLGSYLYILKKQKSLPIKKVVMVGAAFLLVFAVVISILLFSQGSVVYQRMNELWISFKQGGLDKALAERSSSIWKGAAYMIKDYPVAGVGIGAFIIELPNYAQTHQFPLRITDSAENYFIQVFAELGIMGLFFALWIFWLILKRMKKGLGLYLSQDRWRYIQIGVSCGIISMFLIFMVHTFIGSYELKYLFWLLVGMLFVMNRSYEEIEKTIRFGKGFKIFSLIVILIFTGLQLWNSTHSLSLESKTRRLGLNQSFGLYAKEKPPTGKEFQWTKKYSGLNIQIEKPVIKIPVMASHPDIQENPVEVKIYMTTEFFREKRLLDKLVLNESSWKTVEYDVSEEVDNQAIFLFEVSRVWNPWKTSRAPDTRNLGIALGEIKFESE